MAKNPNKILEIRQDLKRYSSVLESTGGGSKGQIICLHEACEGKKPKIFDNRQGWRPHVAHLFTQHGIQVVKQAESTTSIVPFIVRSRNQHKFTNVNVYNKNNPKQLQFMQNLMDLVCVSGVPLNLVEHRVFMKFVRDFDKSIQLPSRRTITRRIGLEAERIIKINASILEKVSDSCLHFSFDLWSTRNHRTVMGIKVRFVDNRWNLRNFTLGILDFDVKKEGKEIRRVFLQEIRERYKIQHHQLGIVMADNARENVSAFGSANVFLEDELISNDPDSSDEDETNVSEEVNGYSEVDACEIIFEDHGEEFFEDGWASKDIVRLGCVNHAIQLVVKECLAKNPRAAEIQLQLEKIVGFFNRSNYWNRKLVKKTKKGFVKVGETRWNGFLISLIRLLEPGFIGNINAVIQEAHEAGRRANVPDMVTPDREVELLELSQLLTPFLTLTKELEGDKVTSSLVILGIITLYKQVASIQCTTEYMKALKTSLCLVITERFGAKDQFYYAGRGAKKNLLRVFDNEAYILATILDPRWKLSPFEIPLNEPYQLERYVPSIEKVRGLILRVYNQEKGNQSEKCSDEEVSQKNNGIPDFMSSFISEASSESRNAGSFQNEIDEYLQEKRLDREADPLDYYRKQSEIGRFPILCRLARKYLGIPSTSSSMERVVSITGSLNRARRASLGTKMMEKFVVYREFRKDDIGN